MERTPKSKLSRNRRMNKCGKTTKGNTTVTKKICSTPPLARQPSICATPIPINPTIDEEEFMSYSPGGFPTTQQGGRGDMDVIWDWSSPNRDNAVLTTASKIKEKSKKNNEIRRPKRCFENRSYSPVLITKTRPDDAKHKTVKGNSLMTVLDQLNDIKQQMNSNIQNKVSTTLHSHSEQISEETVNKSKSNTLICSTVHHDTANENLDSNIEINKPRFNLIEIRNKTKVMQQENENHESESLSKNSTFSDLFVDDDSFSEIMLKCSQQVEQEFFKNNVIDQNKNTIESPKKRNNSNLNKLSLSTKSNKGLIDKEHVNSLLSNSDNSNSSRTVSARKSILSHSRAYLQDDSFDEILSTLRDDDFSVDKTVSNYSNTKNSKSGDTSKRPFVLKVSSEKQTEKNHGFWRSKTCIDDFENLPATQEPHDRSIYLLPTQTTPLPKSVPGFSRHNSMPSSPQVKSTKDSFRIMVNRHNSMPTAQLPNGSRQRSNSERTSSLESIDSRSSSPFQCTPDEIEKKRQDALKRLEARRIQCDIERKRQEALAKLQRKAQTLKSGHRNVPR